VSLNVYLEGETITRTCMCPHCLDEHTCEETDDLYNANITHNLNRMASEAGVYNHLWKPDEIGVTKASQLVEPLTSGLRLLKSDPERFQKFNPLNGWGDYDGLVGFVSKYLRACQEYPEATVRVSR
jgi:hypothetical protein